MITRKEFEEARTTGDMKLIEDYALQIQDVLDEVLYLQTMANKITEPISEWQSKQFKFIGTKEQVVQMKYVLDSKHIQSVYQPQHLTSEFDPYIGQKFELITAQEQSEEEYNDLEGLKLYICEQYPSR